jgi:hypothetical protein
MSPKPNTFSLEIEILPEDEDAVVALHKLFLGREVEMRDLLLRIDTAISKAVQQVINEALENAGYERVNFSILAGHYTGWPPNIKSND